MSEPIVVEVSEDMVRQAILESQARRRLGLPVPARVTQLAAVPLPQPLGEVIDLRHLEQEAPARDTGLQF